MEDEIMTLDQQLKQCFDIIDEQMVKIKAICEENFPISHVANDNGDGDEGQHEV